MAVSSPVAPFLWGQGGAMLSPEQVARDRELAAALMQGGMDYSPVDHWLQGAARAAQGLAGGLKDRWADEAEAAGRGAYQQRWDSVFGGGQGGSDVASALMGNAKPQTALGAANAMAAVPSGGGWLEYANQGATRNQPLSPDLVNAMSFLPELGVTMRVVSGGQEAEGPNRVGSTRHDHGNAGDVDFYRDGRKLDWNNPDDLPVLSNIVSRARANGVTGIGAGDDYMGPGRFHIGFGTEAVWGAGGKGENAPDWLRAAYNGTASPGAPAGVQVAQAGGMGSPDIASLIGLASDPWANDSQRSIANALFGQAMQTQAQANDPLRQLQIQQAQMELEMMRNPAPPKPTDTMRNLEWRAAEAGLVPGTSEYADFMRSGGSGPQVAVDARNMGSIPPGYRVEYDEAGNPLQMVPIPGSPAAIEAEEAAAQAGARQDQAGRYADIVTQDIDRALGLAGGDTTGILGSLLQNVPGTNARNLDALLSTIRANIGFDRLQQMREASPTGGALGAVSEFENRLLQSTLGNLEQSQTEEQLRQNLQRVKDTYLDIIHGPGNRPGEQNQSTVDPLDIDALLELYR